MRWLDFLGALLLASAFGIGLYKLTMALLRGLTAAAPSCDSPPPKPNKKDQKPNA